MATTQVRASTSTRSMIACAILLAVAGSTAVAQEVTNLHPAPATLSSARGASGNQQVGHARVETTDNPYPIDHAALWDRSAGSWIDLHPANANLESYAYTAWNGQQVGWATFGGPHAGYWSGSAASWVDLNPGNGWDWQTFAYGIGDGQQVGYVLWTATGEWQGHAIMWTGTAASAVDLNPPGAGGSVAVACAGGVQVGSADGHAGLWHGTGASWLDLNPAGASSSNAVGIFDNRQVGRAVFDGATHAGMWFGDAASWVDLNPAGASQSWATGININTWVSGAAVIDGITRAGFWYGPSAAEWFDLHALLGPEFTSSQATGVTLGTGVTYISGFGFNSVTNREEALLWTIPAPSALLLLGAAGLLAVRRRGRHGIA